MDAELHFNIIASTGTKSYTSKEWELRKNTIRDLYQQGLQQKELLETLATKYGFHPTPAMLKKRISQWRIDRKNKESDIVAALRISLPRRSIGKRTAFQIRGRIVDESEIQRYLRRKGIKDVPEYVASAPQVPSSSVIPFTPPASPGPGGEASYHKECDAKQACVFDNSYSQVRCGLGHTWNTTPMQALAKSIPQGRDQMTAHPATNVGGLLDLTITEKLLLFNDVYHNISLQKTDRGNTNINISDVSQATVGIDNLRAFTNGMWRGRELLLEDQYPLAFQCFNEAFGSLPELLSSPHKQFLTELYEMILNFQLDERKDIISKVLEHVAEICESRKELNTNSWRVGMISRALSRTKMADRAAIAECLIRNVRNHYGRIDSFDAQEAQSIDKILSRSLFRRKNITQAITYLEKQLREYDASGAVDLYDSCTVLVELAQCHRFQKQYKEAIHHVKLAWHRAQIHNDAYGCVDIKIRCVQTIALSEAKRGNFYLSLQHAKRAVVLANTYLGPECSLTSLVEAELDDITSKMENLQLNTSAPLMDSEAAFWLPLDVALDTYPVDQPLKIAQQNSAGQAECEQSHTWLGS